MAHVIAKCCKVSGPQRLGERIATRQRMVEHFLSDGKVEF